MMQETNKILPFDPIVKATIDLGYTSDGLFCVRDPNNTWLLDCGSPGTHTALAIAYTESVPDGSELKFVTGDETYIYDDTRRVARIIGERNEFFITPNNEIIIRIDPMYHESHEGGMDYILFYVRDRINTEENSLE